MKKIISTILFVFVTITICLGQKTTFSGGWTDVDYQGKRFRLSSIEIDRSNNKTYVTIEVEATKNIKEIKPPICEPRIIGEQWESVYSHMDGSRYIDESDYSNYITEDGKTGRFSGDGNNTYPAVWKNVKKGDIHWYILVFNVAIPYGETSIRIKSADCSVCSQAGFRELGWTCTINNPMPNLQSINVSETIIKSMIDKQNDGVSGIYEILERDGLRLACIKHEGMYKLIYLSGGRVKGWKSGEIKATLSETSVPRLFKANWYDEHKQIEKETVLIGFDELTMEVKIGDETVSYLQMYPTSESSISIDENITETWTGTGFAIGSGYIVTNNHVASEAKTIRVKGVKGDVDTGYLAEVVAADKVNDIAILRISDSRFTGFGTIPYAVQQRMADVGEDVFVLGYPLTQALGNEIKLTNGIISSRTGYQGNVSTYQMSAPVQPGNSGGPLFDNKGNIIGIVVAGVPGAENVGYAIKTSYLNILIESAGLNIKLPANNSISTLSLAEKVKRVKNFVFYIECSK
jgi:S1-C subfamily serine protease